MSFNLRLSTAAHDGINAFENRMKKILAVIAGEDPDIIGFQEVTDFSRTWLKKSLAENYVVLGCGRNGIYAGEGCSVAFRTADVELLEMRTHWLSPTPNVPGTRYTESDQSECPRMYTAMRLKHHEGQTPFWIYNVHLDHKGKEVRLTEMRQILSDIAAQKEKFILTGDFNAAPDSPEMQLPFTIPCREVCEATKEILYTFHGFGKRLPGVKIDYIFTDFAVDECHAVEDKGENGIYCSDHYPVCATVLLD